MHRLQVPFLLLFLLLASSCHTHFVRQQGQFVQMNAEQSSDSIMTAKSIQPYKIQLDSAMNTVVCQSTVGLTKMQPESTMGNWAADAVAKKTADYTGKKVDIAVLNYGGLRVASMPKGNITKGNIFEVMPFDNLMILLEMKGSDLPLLFDHIAGKEGWPVSAGLKMTLKDKKAINITLNGQAIDPNRVYMIATNDYLANGGDNCTFFVDKVRYDTGKFLRDAVIEYCIELQKAGKTIDNQLEGRITKE